MNSRILPPYVLKNSKLSSSREFKALKRKQARKLRRQLDELRGGCAFFPSGSRDVEIAAEAVFAARTKAMSIEPLEDTYEEPKLRIYMDYDFWYQCMLEIHGNVSSFEHEFYERQTIMGCDVYQVPKSRGGKTHPAYEVVTL